MLSVNFPPLLVGPPLSARLTKNPVAVARAHACACGDSSQTPTTLIGTNGSPATKTQACSRGCTAGAEERRAERGAVEGLRARVERRASRGVWFGTGTGHGYALKAWAQKGRPRAHLARAPHSSRRIVLAGDNYAAELCGANYAAKRPTHV